MQKVISIALNDLRIFFAQRGNLISLLLIPIALTTVLGFSLGSRSRVYQIAVLDQDGTPEVQTLVSDIESVDASLRIQISTQPSEFELKQQVASGELDAALIIPSGFGANIATAQPIELIYYSRESVGSTGVIQQSLAAVIGRWNATLVASRTGQAVAERLGIVLDGQVLRTQAETILASEPIRYDFATTAIDEQSQTQNGFGQSVPGMGATFVMFTVLGAMVALFRERKEWTLQRLVAMPISRASIIGGKILSFFALGMIQFVVVMVVGIAFGLNFGSSYLAYLLVAGAFTLAITALAMAIATRIREEGQADMLATMLSMVLASLGGAWWPLEIVPDFMRTVGHISPVAWAMDGFHKLIYFGGGLVDVLPEIAILLAISGVCFAIGIVRFRYE